MGWLSNLFGRKSEEQLSEPDVVLVHRVQVADDFSAQSSLHVHCPAGGGYTLVVEADPAVGDVAQREVPCGFEIRCSLPMGVVCSEQKAPEGQVILKVTLSPQDLEVPVAMCTVMCPPDAKRVVTEGTIEADGVLPKGLMEALGIPTEKGLDLLLIPLGQLDDEHESAPQATGGADGDEAEKR